MRKLLIFLISVILILSACGNKEPENATQEPVIEDSTAEVEKEPIDHIGNMIATMSNEEIVGQMLVFTFDGTLSPNSSLLELIEKTNCANFMLLEKNCKDTNQIIELLDKIDENNPNKQIPYWYCIDEEGGVVSRLNLGLPSARMTAEYENPLDVAYRNGVITALALREVGIQLCLAPVMDTATDIDRSSLNSRIFDSDPAVVGEMGSSFIKGLHDNGVASTTKHFPGIGNSTVDSHDSFPYITATREEVENFELVPFKTGIENGTDVVMIGHVITSALDPDNPATISKKIQTDLLRNELKFGGVIMTDDMFMDSMTSTNDLPEACLQAVLSGTDMVLTLGQEQEIYDKLISAVNDGTLSRERLEESMRRILNMKWKYMYREQISDGVERLRNPSRGTKTETGSAVNGDAVSSGALSD